MKTPSYLSRLQAEFEHKAFSYGVEPAVCTLLGEFVAQKAQYSWKKGHEYAWKQAYSKFKNTGQNPVLAT